MAAWNGYAFLADGTFSNTLLGSLGTFIAGILLAAMLGAVHWVVSINKRIGILEELVRDNNLTLTQIRDELKRPTQPPELRRR